MPKSIAFDQTEILETVTRLFWQKGYNGTSMQDLVDATGLNRSSIYNTFGDKFSLYEQALKHYQTINYEGLTKASSQPSAIQAIRSVFRGVIIDLKNGKGKDGCMLANCATELGNRDQRITDFLADNQEKILSVMETLVSKAQEQGDISTHKNAKTLALYLFTSLNGLRVVGILQQDLEDVVNEILSHL